MLCQVINSRNMKVIYSLCFCMGLLSQVQTDHCTVDMVDVCLTPLKESDIISNSTIVPTLSIKDMEEHCSIYQKFESCMEDVTPHCTDIDRTYFEGLEDSYHWLCEENFEGYKKHRDCFATKQLHVEGDICNTTYSERLGALSSNGQSSSYNFDRICHYSNDYLDCVFNAVDSFCGEEAAKWQREFDKRSLEPLLDLISCDISESGSGSGLSAVTVGIVVFLVLLALCICIGVLVACFVCKKKRVPVSSQAGVPNVVYSGSSSAVNMGYPGPHPAEAGPIPHKQGPSPPPYDGYDASAPPVLGSGEQIAGPAINMNNPYYATSQPPPYTVNQNGMAEGVAGGTSDRAASVVSYGEPPAKKY